MSITTYCRPWSESNMVKTKSIAPPVHESLPTASSNHFTALSNALLASGLVVPNISIDPRDATLFALLVLRWHLPPQQIANGLHSSFGRARFSHLLGQILSDREEQSQEFGKCTSERQTRGDEGTDEDAEIVEVAEWICPASDDFMGITEDDMEEDTEQF